MAAPRWSAAKFGGETSRSGAQGYRRTTDIGPHRIKSRSHLRAVPGVAFQPRRLGFAAWTMTVFPAPDGDRPGVGAVDDLAARSGRRCRMDEKPSHGSARSFASRS